MEIRAPVVCLHGAADFPSAPLHGPGSSRHAQKRIMSTGLHNTATPRHGRPPKRGEFLTSRNSSKMLVPACFRVRTLMAASNRSNSTWRPFQCSCLLIVNTLLSVHLFFSFLRLPHTGGMCGGWRVWELSFDAVKEWQSPSA